MSTFDDLNPETRGQWAYPDTGVWDPERNLAEFLAVLPEWREAGLLAFTVEKGPKLIGHWAPVPSDGELRTETLEFLKALK